MVFDPDWIAFRIPYVDHPVAWYGILFALGFYLAYLMAVPRFGCLLGSKEEGQRCTDKLLLYIILGTVIGARLGHILLYDLDFYWAHPGEILKVWKGGLASHGGTLGVILSIWLFARTEKKISVWTIMDMAAMPVALAVTFIRTGNFINQEILGTPTTVPWAVTFGHPEDGSWPEPRHPVQLYEALAYFATFCLLFFLEKRSRWIQEPGRRTGLFLILVFGSRFFLEFFKADLRAVVDQNYLSAGQILSIPFILFGIYCCFFKRKSS